LVPEGKALSTGFSVDEFPQTGMAYALAAFPRGQEPAPLEQQVRSVLTAYLKNGFPEELVDAARRQEATAAELKKNSVSGLAMAWSQAVAVEGRNSPEDDLQAIQRVTAADVNRVARQYLKLDQTVTAILTPVPSGKPISSAPVGGRESLAINSGKSNVALPDWAARALNRLSIPPSTLKPVASTLTNGIRLIVQPESVSHTVSVYGHIENNADVEAPAGQEGVSDLLEELFSYGTTSMDRLAFQKALDDIGAVESAGTRFSLEVLTAQFDRGVKLLAGNELHPALPEPAFNIVRRQLASAVEGRLESPGYLTERAFRQLLVPPDDPTLREATPQTISPLTLSEVRQYYQRVFRPDLTTIVVMGEITPEKARAVVEKYFGAWTATGPKPPTTLPPVPLNKASATQVPDSSRMQDSVRLGETLGLVRSSPDYYALELGNHVLGGGFYATRLYRDLRENGGLVYNVSSEFEMGKTRGRYEVQYACDPMNVFQARAIVERDLKQMQSTPIGPEELQQAKAMLLREIPLSESSVSRIAGAFLTRTTLDLPLDEPTRAAHKYLSLTAEDVKTAMAKWIRVSDLVQVTQGPPPKL
jgi:zinc protease